MLGNLVQVRKVGRLRLHNSENKKRNITKFDSEMANLNQQEFTYAQQAVV
jgi:hypothetical protein